MGFLNVLMNLQKENKRLVWCKLRKKKMKGIFGSKKPFKKKEFLIYQV